MQLDRLTLGRMAKKYDDWDNQRTAETMDVSSENDTLSFLYYFYSIVYTI